MKPGPNYRMSSLLKISLATGKFTDAHQRGAWKRACIDAELCAAIQPKREKRPAGPGGYAKNPTGTASTRN
jgi:hypothetical protein